MTDKPPQTGQTDAERGYSFAIKVQNHSGERRDGESTTKGRPCDNVYLELMHPSGITHEYQLVFDDKREIKLCEAAGYAMPHQSVFKRRMKHFPIREGVNGNYHYTDEIRFPITDLEYHAINMDLSSREPQFYHYLLHNCAKISMEVAKEYGFDVPEGSLFVTPASLSETLRELNKQHLHDEALRDAIGEADIAGEWGAGETNQVPDTSRRGVIGCIVGGIKGQNR